MASLSWMQAGAQQSPAFSKQEREAIEIVNAWNTAWATKDGEKVASYMAEDVQYTDEEDKPFKKGRAQFIQDYKTKYVNIVESYDVVASYAAGDSDGVAVMQKRIDNVISFDGKQKMKLPYVGFFKVRNGKIVEWIDVRIAKIPPGLMPPTQNTEKE